MILRYIWHQTRLSWSTRCSSTSSTIFALATGSQIRSGVAIIRISGSSATQALLSLTNETDLTVFRPNQLYLRKIYHNRTKDLLDRCMVVWFKGRILLVNNQYASSFVYYSKDREASLEKILSNCNSSSRFRMKPMKS
jgi:hypothetical protein